MEVSDIALDKNQFHTFYTSYFHYYNTLSPQWQIKFIKRALYFIKHKSIIGAEGFIVTNKIKALVSASAVQLTLGLDTWDYDYFMDIIIHPRIYTNQQTKLKHKGETNLNGHIRLSWLSFIEGYKNLNDNINLGIHEFSHALRFNGIRGNEQDYYMKYFFVKWLNTAYEAFFDLRKGKESIFRAYGGTNINEFISVCFEHFFESPHEIKEKYPFLYYNTVILLNQETANNITISDAREKALIEKNGLMYLVKPKSLTQLLNSQSALTLVFICATLYISTSLKIGFLSGPSIILAILASFFYGRFERNYLNLSVFQNVLIVSKGFKVFKKFRQKKIFLSQIVNIQYAEQENVTEMIFIYYCLETKHFYEENMECHTAEFKEFVKEFKENKIAIYKKK